MLIFSKARIVRNVFSYVFCRNMAQQSILKLNSANTEYAYFRFNQNDDHFELSFLYSDSTQNILRQFNLQRNSQETVGVLLSRIGKNVETMLCKKKKKKKNKTTEGDTATEEPLNVKLLEEGVSVPDDKLCTQIFRSNSNIELLVTNNKYHVTVNAPWLTTITLPTSILSGFPLYPVKFDGVFFIKEKCEFKWYCGMLVSNPKDIKWTEVGNGFDYYPTMSDIGAKVKLICIPKNDTMTGPQMEIISTASVEAGPGFCPFENRHMFTKERLSGDLIRVVSYNILADLYCDSDFTRTELFPYCPPYALNIDYRKQLFIKEITGYNGDIVCLQEVDRKIFNYDLLPIMASKSCNGLFTRKGGEVSEGLACFYRNDRFQFIEEKSCTLGEIISSPLFEDIWSSIRGNEAFVDRMQARTTVAHAVVLESLDNSNEVVVVGNTHLYFKPDADHIRVMQAGVAIRWLCNIIEELKTKIPDKRISLIFCGDFNSVPSCGVYKLFTTGYVPSNFVDWRSNAIEAVTNVELKQPLPLGSACGTPTFTNFTIGFADCLDYIFYHKGCFDVSQVVPLPSIEELVQHSALPSVVFPSDHVALVADLKFKNSDM